jgi:hypothetical protein
LSAFSAENVPESAITTIDGTGAANATVMTADSTLDAIASTEPYADDDTTYAVTIVVSSDTSSGNSSPVVSPSASSISTGRSFILHTPAYYFAKAGAAYWVLQINNQFLICFPQKFRFNPFR